MAYKTIKHTKVSYNASGFISYQEIEMEKMYYMPDVIDEPNNYWTINGLNKLTGEVVLMLNECPIRTGYRILITELNNNDVSTYHIHILNTNNELILDQSVLSSEYGLSSMRFISSAYIMPITVPVKPIGLVATVLSKNSISLTWTDNSDNEASFIIQRSLNGTTWTEVGTVNENITSYIDNGLNPSTSYQYRIIARNAFGNSLPSTKKTATTLPEVPVAPSDLIVEVMSQSVMQLSWTDNANNEDGYVVQISLNGSTWANIATISTPNVNSYISTGLTSGTKYFHRVYAYNTGGNSEYIIESATTLPSIPVAPSGLSATVSGLNITLNWLDNANNEDGYKLERSLYGSKTFEEIAMLSSNVTTYEDTDLPSGTEYEYRVRAYNIAGNSTYSNIIQVTTMNAPNAPTSLVGEAITETRIDISWNDNSLDETIFKVERSDDAGATWTEIATTLADEYSYKDYDVTTGTTYSYRVRAYNIIGNSAYSNVISLNPLSVPEAPSNLAATFITDTQINLSWTDNSDDEVGFKLQRSLDGISSWNTIYTAAPNETSYNHTGLTHSTTYYYRIFAYNDVGNSNFSNVMSATTDTVAPSNLLGAVSGLDVSLTWTYDVNSQNEFIVERSVYGSKVWSQIATIAAQTTSYNDIGLSSATRYEYRVKAFNLSNQSEYSNIVDVTTSAAPDAPLEFVGFADNQNGYIEFMWSDLTDETGYILERSSDGGSTWSELANIAADEFSYKDYTATPGVSYSYRIKGYNAVGDGAYSSVLELGLPGVPDAPTNLTATTAGSTQINLTWTDNSNDEVGFKLQISLDQSTWNTIYTAQAGETSYSNTGLNSTTTYYYRVFAYNDIGNSDYSNIGDAKTFLSAPINLTATVPTGLYVELNWTNTDASTVGYEIERKADSSKTWIQIATTTVNKTTYDDENVISGVNYDYRVRSYNGDGNSDYSDVATQLLQ